MTRFSSWVHHFLDNLLAHFPTQARAVRPSLRCRPTNKAHGNGRYRIPAIISSVIVTIAAIATFIWALVKQGDIGPLWKNPEQVYGIGRLEGSELSWTMMRMISSGIGGWAGGIMYQSGKAILSVPRQLGGLQGSPSGLLDFSRYAVNDGDQVWGQIFIIPLCLFGSNLLGIITTSCARGLYPDEPLLWSVPVPPPSVQGKADPRDTVGVYMTSSRRSRRTAGPRRAPRSSSPRPPSSSRSSR